MPMPLPSRNELTAAGLAAALLLAGGAALAWTADALGAVSTARPGTGPAPSVGYYRAVVLKGLVPQLVLTVLLHPALRRFRVRQAGRAHREEAEAPGGGALFVETFVVASLAYCVVAPLGLGVAWPGWPALSMEGPAEQLGTYVGMTAAVSAAMRGAAHGLERLRGPRRGAGPGA